MSGVLKLSDSYDLWITYSWSKNNHGICGHIFEVIDYYHILKDHFKTGILLCEDIDWNTFECAIRSKYNFREDEILEMRGNTVFCNRPSVVKGKSILITDGGVINTSKVFLYFNNIIYFACGNREIKDNVKSNVFVLQDSRVYEPVKVNGVNYKKKILFDRLNPIGDSKDNMLVYATKNCRDVSNYSELLTYNMPILAITNNENMPPDIEGIAFFSPPVDNLFEQFTTYLYTPTNRKWDCSPRFIAECKYYNKQVIYHNIDYWEADHGLRWRVWDIDNDFDSLYLRPDDDIVPIMKRICSE